MVFLLEVFRNTSEFLLFGNENLGGSRRFPSFFLLSARVLFFFFLIVCALFVSLIPNPSRTSELPRQHCLECLRASSAEVSIRESLSPPILFMGEAQKDLKVYLPLEIADDFPAFGPAFPPHSRYLPRLEVLRCND